MIPLSETFTGRCALVSSASATWGGSSESSYKSSTGISLSPRMTSCPIIIPSTRYTPTRSFIPQILLLLLPRRSTTVALSIWQKTRSPHGVTAMNQVLPTPQCPPSPLPSISPPTSLTQGKRRHPVSPLQDPVVRLWTSVFQVLWISSTPSLSQTSGVHHP
jgi:hypothetical protein